MLPEIVSQETGFVNQCGMSVMWAMWQEACRRGV